MISNTLHADIDNWTLTTPAARSTRGVVASQHRVAARAGAAQLDAGGNAIDAIVATAYALNAVEPWMCGLGGAGFMVIWLAKEKRAVALDFQGTLPGGIRLEDYPVDPERPRTPMGFPGVIDNANIEGYRSITVPGAVAGLDHALSRFGSRSRREVMTPAIQLAERGLFVDWFTSLQIGVCARTLARDPVSAAIYLPGGHPATPESRLKIPRLAETLDDIAEGGAESFYRGALAEKIVADLQAGGSRISCDDFAAYEVFEYAPMAAEHRGYTLYTPGEVSGGLRQREMLAHTLKAMPTPPETPTAESWLAYAEALEACWRQHKIRNGVLAPTDGHTDGHTDGENGACTSSMSSVDAEGNMVALTYTLLNRFGSGVTLPSTGMLMNDSVSYFDPRPGYPTTMAGGKRINSSNMCPTVAVKADEARFSVGASGGNLIMPAVTQVAALMMDFDMSVETAVHHPRLDASFRGSIRVDPRFDPATLSRLGERFALEIAQQTVFPKLYACVSAVARDPLSGECTGLNDPTQPVGGGAAPAPFEIESLGDAGPVVRP
ncbi:gamma-glutamyltransferase family protein [Salinicola rhizosphaerae]|uniref:Gamma-glutamyltransferase n=1 Tax=Salinicola rhizosphaerae TaxID=1443141 RepID=A0ABQ3DT13_9GAMM|nr:gamma-glutamyltransferase [Salinicola rhizosphaerae]GHB11996.1 gamma-glutamyltransferase [Salinicola rhizosphaerae]